MDGDEEKVVRSVFANELLEIYELVRTVLRDEPSLDINVAVANCLPVHSQ